MAQTTVIVPHQAPFDALCVGETMVMVTPNPGGRLDADSNLVLRAGGAESNVAMYLSSLGHRVAWASRVGDDPLGEVLLAEVSSAGVDTSLVERSSTQPTGVYFKDPKPGHTAVYYYRKGSAASAMGRGFARKVSRLPAKVIHISGVTAALSADCRELLDKLVVAAQATNQLISFDVNYRPSLWPSGADVELLRLARAADVIFVGLDEAATLWGTNTADDVRKLIDVPNTLVVKDGAIEATVFHTGGRVTAPALPVDVIDAVGAGDAFAAGWLSGTLRNLDHSIRLKLGHYVAGAALRSNADFAHLPPEAEIYATLGIPPDRRHGVSGLP